MSTPAITARNISVTFTRQGTYGRLRRASREPDSVRALDDVSFEVRHGEAFGIIGPNGAGKSTLMRVIGQTLVPDAGNLSVRGATSTLLQLGVGFNPQLDGSRNIRLGLLAAGLSMKQIDEIHDEIWEYSELGEALYRPLATYSRGMQSRLAFAIATFVEADILLVDEVLAVGDESFKQKSLATMRELLENAGTIVMVSHALGTVQEFCDRVMWLEDGKVRQIGDPTTVVAAYRDQHTLGNVRLLRATRGDVDQKSRPLHVRRPEPLDTELLRANRKTGGPALYSDPAPPTPARAAPRRARKLLDRGWRIAKGDMMALEPPIDWPDDAASGAHPALMAWDPIGTLLMANAAAPDPRWVAAATAIAVDWSGTYGAIDDSAIWDAPTTARRAIRLAMLVDQAARDPLMSDDHLGELTVLAQLHAWALADDGRFAERDLVALAQIEAAFELATRVGELPATEELEQQARHRLRVLIDAGLSRDGIWMTHTPTHHAHVIEALTRLAELHLPEDRDLIQARNKAEKALAWFVLPDGTAPGFGQVEAFTASDWLAGAPKPSTDRIKQRWRTGPMRAAASAGQAGRTPAETTRAFRRGGYVVLRSRWPDRPNDPDAAYVAMMAGRHSTRGKHADDLAVVWFDRGHHLLVDAGAYRGDSDESLHRYLGAARAHNTIEIDGVDQFPGEPIGSGARQAGSLGSLRYGIARTQFGNDLILRRMVVLEPGAWLLVLDWTRDRTDAAHVYRQWFHLGADFEMRPEGHGPTFAASGTELHTTSLSGATLVQPVHGVVDPRQGWIAADDLVVEPAWAFGYEASFDGTGGFATLLSLSGPPTGDSATLTGHHGADVRFVVGGEQVELEVDLRADVVLRRR